MARAMKIDTEVADRLRPVIREAMRQMIHSACWDFGKAAERGIAQAANLICDPDYYERKKVGRKRSAINRAERDAQQRRERLIIESTPPTDDEMARERNRLERDAWWHRQELERIQKRLAQIGVPVGAMRGISTGAKPQ
jgi:hypothetical protein